MTGATGVGHGSCMPGPFLPHASVDPAPIATIRSPAGTYFDRLPGVDWKAAYAVQHYDAQTMRTADYRGRGYTSIEENKALYAWRCTSAAATPGFADDDFCVAQVAKALGNTEDADRYLKRSKNWTNVWNPAITDGPFKGFPNARSADGSFSGAVARHGNNNDVYEGICWIYGFRPTYDFAGLCATLGGPATFHDRLLFGLKNNLIDITNEPSFQTIWLFDLLDRPYLTSKWANYLLHGGTVPKVTFRLHDGKSFTVLNTDAGPGNVFVQTAAWNGKPLNHARLSDADLFQGGTLEMRMGNKPSPWACAGEFDAGVAAAELKWLRRFRPPHHARRYTERNASGDTP